MAIPFATTTIAVLRAGAGASDDPYDPQPERETVASGVRAHISTSTGYEQTQGGSQSIGDFRVTCDPTDIRHTDRIVDEVTGEEFDVEWATPRRGLGLDHTFAGLKQVKGAL